MKIWSATRTHSPIWVTKFGLSAGGYMIYVGPWRARVVRPMTSGTFPNGSRWFSGFHRRTHR